MNIERLEHLKEILSKVPVNQFDLGVWIVGAKDNGKKFEQLIGGCGTSACAIGWACTDAYFNKQGLHYHIDEDDLEEARLGEIKFEDVNGFPVFEGKKGFYAVCKFFDIPYNISEWLFLEEYYEFDKIKPKDVIDKIDIYMNNVGTSWTGLNRLYKEFVASNEVIDDA